MNGLFAGLDVSTQSCKLVVIDLESRSTVFVDSVHYDEDLPRYGTVEGVVQGMELINSINKCKISEVRCEMQFFLSSLSPWFSVLLVT